MRKYLFIAFFSISFIALPQCMEKPTGNKKIAKNYLAFGQFKCALEEFKIMYQEKPGNPKINQAMAECYLGIPGEGARAIKHAELVVKKGNYEALDLYNLALAYHQGGQFKKALTTAEKYLKEFAPQEIELEVLEELISKCKTAIELTKFPISIKFENLGDKVNSEWNDLNPLCKTDESEIYFTTTRDNVMGGYSYGNGYISDVFVTKLSGSRYSKPRSIGSTFNSIDIDELAGSSINGRYLFVSTDSEGFQIFNLKMSYLRARARSYPKPENLEGINSNTSNEHSATITNNGQVIIFSSDREGGFGGYDLYISRKLPNQTWGEAVNLGPTINTKKNEMFPRFTELQDKIIFSSQGHVNMGGFDLFSSTFSNEFKDWTTPENLGYPINTQYDDYSIWYLQNNRYAYKSHYDTSGFGMADLYRLVFLDSTPQFSIITFNMEVEESVKTEESALKLENDTSNMYLDSLQQLPVGEDSVLVRNLIDSVNYLIDQRNLSVQELKPNCFAEVSVSNSDTEVEYGQYKSNPIKGGVLMILEPGKYDLSIEAEGFHPVNKSLIVNDKNQFQTFINEQVILKRK